MKHHESERKQTFTLRVRERCLAEVEFPNEISWENWQGGEQNLGEKSKREFLSIVVALCWPIINCAE